MTEAASTPTDDAYAPPLSADAGLVVIHGAGSHERLSTLDELINPLLARLRDEGNLISVSPFILGNEDLPGGQYDGITVDYVPDPDDAPNVSKRLMVVEARWDKSFAEPRLGDVSTFSAAHSGRLAWELALYFARSPFFLAIAAVILGLVVAGIVAMRDHLGWGIGLLLGAWLLAYLVALIDVTDAWNDREERVSDDDGDDRDGMRTREWGWSFIAALTMMTYHVQRGLVIVVSLIGVVLLPVAAALIRLLGTIPGIDAIARNTISTLERQLLSEAPTDAHTISANTLASGAIQARVSAAMRETELRVRAGGPITVLAHSAGAVIGWWLLSEPSVHRRQRLKRFSYRLVTVGGALNWSKRGLDTHAMPLDMPLVNSERADASERTTWLNIYSTWDPAPHGAIRTEEFSGEWNAWGSSREAASTRRSLWSMLVRARWPGARATSDARKDPNIVVRNLGSPISAEHSEYFRNQQEFIPLLLRAVDEEIAWSARDASARRRERFSNARLALISPLVRMRVCLFALPLAALIAGLADSPVVTLCGGGRFDLGEDIARSVDRLLANLPFVDWSSREMCANTWARISIEDMAVVVVFALVAFAVVEVYTSYCWQNLGRRVHSLDPDDDRPRGWWPPSAWRAGKLPLVSAMFVWLPTVIAPLAFLVLYEDRGLILVAAVGAIATLEVFWFERCLRGLADMRQFANTGRLLGRRRDRSA